MNKNEKRTVVLILMFASVYVISSSSSPDRAVLTKISGGIASIVRFKFIHGLAIPRDEFFGKISIFLSPIIPRILFEARDLILCIHTGLD